MVGTRWDPIDVVAVPAPDREADGADTPADLDPSTGTIAYIEPERLGSIVEPVAVTIGKSRITLDVDMPDAPGRYRLVMTLHDDTTVAYDGPTQALVPGVIVEVNPRVAARYLVAPPTTVQAGRELRLPLAVANVGAETWGQAATDAPRSAEDRASYPVLVAHWMALDVEATEESIELPADTRTALTAGQPPGARKRLALGLIAPAGVGVAARSP